MFSTRAFKEPWVASCAGAVAFVVLCGAFVFPLLRVGFVGDDIYRSAIPAYASLSHLTVFEALRAIAGTADQATRAPLQMLLLAFWFLRPPEIVARVLQSLLLIANVATFALLAGRLFGTRAAGVLATVCALATLQIRFGNDAILGQTGTSTIGCALVLLALLAWLRFSEMQSSYRLGIALAAYAIALTSDASAVALLPVVVILIMLENEWTLGKRALAAAAFAIAGVTLLAIDHALFPGRMVSPSLGAMLGQLVAVLPLAYRAFHWLIPGGASPGGTPPDQRFLNVPGAGLAGFLLSFGGMTAAYVALKSSSRLSQRPGIGRATVIGAGLWIVPALLTGHATATITQPLPIAYAQSFGVALLMTAGLTIVGRWYGLGRYPALAPLALLFIGLTLLGNSAEARLVAQHSVQTGAVRSAIERGAASGLFESIPDGSTLALDAKSYPFRFTDDWRNASYLFYLYARRRYEIVPAATVGAGANDRTWIVRSSKNAKEGFTQLAFERYADGSATGLRVDQAVVYRTFDTSALRADGMASLNAGGRGVSLTTSASGETGVLVLARRTCGPVEEALALAPTSPTIGWGRGFLPDLNYVPAEIILSAEMPYYEPTEHQWRFMGRSGELVVDRDSCRQTPLVLTMTVASAAPTILRVSTLGRVGLFPISQFPYTLQFDIPDNRQQPARIFIQTNGPAARLFDWAPRRPAHDFTPDARLFVSKPKAQYL